MSDLTSYPVCIDDGDCAKKQDHVCFQFFCYPWKETAGTDGRGRQTVTDFRKLPKSRD